MMKRLIALFLVILVAWGSSEHVCLQQINNADEFYGYPAALTNNGQLSDTEYESCYGSWCMKRSKTELNENTVVLPVQPTEVCCPGYKGQPPDNCVDVNECSSGDNGGCSQYCHNTDGSYYCRCDEEYQLTEDGKSCNSTTIHSMSYHQVNNKRSADVTKDYYVAGMVNYDSSSTGYYLYLTTQSTTGVSYTVKNYYSSTISSGTVYKSSPKKISLSTSYLVTSHLWSQRKKGYHVHTNGPSSLFIFNHLNHAIGEYPAYAYEKPAGVSTYTYYVVSTGTKSTSSRSQILLVGNEASTTITVYPKATVQIPYNTQSSWSYAPYVYSWGSKTFTLHKLQTLLIRAVYSSSDLTGSRIVSNKPLTVVTGHQCGNIPSNIVYCEHISEQIPPTFDWGKKFMLTPYLFRNRHYYMVVSQASSTKVQHNCNGNIYTIYVNAGNKYTFYTTYSQKCYLQTDKPVLVTQMAPGRGIDGFGDPAISVVPPMTKFDTSASFYLPVYSYLTKFGFNIVAKQKTGTWRRNGYIMYLTWYTINDLSSNIVGYYARYSMPSYYIYSYYSNQAQVITNSNNNEFYILGYGFGVDIAYSFTTGILSEDCDNGYKLVLGECQDINECLSNPCNGVGQVCTNTDGSFMCDCPSGYSLVNNKCKDINECSAGTDSCEHNCYNTIGSYYCTCNSGYQLYDKYHCKDIDECQANTDGCAQICTNTVGSFTCSCKAGYYLVWGKYCFDVNECSNNKGGCSHNCINTYGSYYCSCNSGYYLTGNGKTCQDINECAYACPQDCTNTIGSYTCSCFPGYSGSNCQDINECSNNKGGCAQTCTNTIGSFYCSCGHGYVLSSNKKTCTDVNECDTNNGGCEHNCQNTVGSYKCTCNSGYDLDGDGHGCSPSCPDACGHCSSCNSPNSCSCVPGWKGSDCCTDKNECSTNNGGCDQICHNSQGSFSCDCNVGYTLNANGKKCDDKNECSLDTDECNHNCINTVGSYSCSCNIGYELGLDDHTCVDTKECDNNNGGCAQTCTETEGSFTCSCGDGYTLNSNGKSCDDINECTQGTDDCTNTCYNTVGSYQCGCPVGYELANDGVTCNLIDYCDSDNNGCEQICDSEVGGYHCECLTGYILDDNGKNCSDHDECANNVDACQHTCHNLHSSYYCTCDPGYTLDTDGRTCNDIDECALYISGCAHKCTNTAGSYTCTCLDGYTLDSNGKTCTDINECLTNKGGCAQTCTNTDGSFTCSCGDGYELAFDNLACDDINECTQGTDYCEQTCTNNNGGYTCSCNTGYQLNGKYHCEDIDECDTNNGGCGQTCVNTIGSFKCTCKEGYSLASNGLTCNNINECNDNDGGCEQTCTDTAGSYECSCKNGYSLDDNNHGCSPVCPDACGHCSSCDSPNSCSCVDGWKGSDCCTDTNECSTNNGGCDQICHNSQGSFSCDCNVGYSLNANGKKCDDKNECSLDTDECNHNCINTVGSYSCSCNIGYELGLDDHTCIDTNECLNNNGGCAQTCTNTEGSFTCSCDDGYTANGKECDDIDECADGIDDCSNTCVNNIGSYTCDCPTGYELEDDGVTCADINECNDDNGGCNQTCFNEEGTYHCECITGYWLDEDKHGCSDHDECANNVDACDHTCHNSHSSYYCTCNTGYTLDTDGRTCNDIDECALYISGCAHKCTNTAGSYTCTCLDGYTLDSNGKTCTDINECLNNNGGCAQTCTNTDGSFTCSCDDGYELAFDNLACDDINECTEGTDYCEHFCDNTIGGYTCSCMTGFQESENGYHCSNINECNNKNGGCGQICNDTVGSYKCSCKPGYLLNSDSSSCDEIDECLNDNGGCEHTCTNTPGSYSCSCNDGYNLDLANKGCIPICQDACGNCDECLSPGFCSCKSGWEGKDCCVDIDECDDDNGGCGQICHNTDGSRACDCESGYEMDSDGVTCNDIDECALDTDKCNQMCTNTDGSYLCFCKTGYELELDNHTCVDTNECGILNGGCNQTCENTISSYYCECKIGFNLEPDKHGCVDIDECATHTDNCSHTCYNNIGSYTCDCPLGFVLDEDQTTCIDFDECSVDNGNCNQTCINTNGSYYCECLKGYILDEDLRNCSDHDECAQNIDNCDQHCHNSHSSYYCTCDLGYLLDTDGRMCNDVNECEEHLSGCNQICNNTVGSYVCDCYIGYELLDTNPRECIDINECLFDNGGCEQNCTNLSGSYKCWCIDGYKLNHDKHSCDDIDECALGIDSCEHNCHNDIGSYHCTCKDGYYLEDNGWNCTDIDECLVDNGGCDQTCVNIIASYYCECWGGYRLDEDGHGCYDIIECDSFNGGCDHYCHNEIGSYNCSCYNGYELTDNQHSCIGQRCVDTLSAPSNGIIECTGEQVTDESCSFSCLPGYQLRKSPYRRCKPDHTWTGTEPYCEPLHCRPLKRPDNAHVVTDPCPTELMSMCMVECVEGYHMTGSHMINESVSGTYQQCRVNETTGRLYWTESPTCTYKPPCSSNPCQNGGTCRNMNSYEYRCDCHTATGYKGRNCETGVINIPQVPVISVTGSTSTSSSMTTISCQPTTELIVTMTTSDNHVTTSPSSITFTPTDTSSILTVTAHSDVIPGIYYIYFHVSGQDVDSYETPSPMMIIVHDPYQATNHTINQYFDYTSQPVGILSPGCCEQTIQDYFTPDNQQQIEFNSSCSWSGLGTIQSTGGITFASFSGLDVPLSVAGSSLSVLELGIPNHSLPVTPLEECAFCNTDSTSLHCQYSVTVEDVMDFISCHALTKTFLSYTNTLLPSDWLQIQVPGGSDSSSTDILSLFDSFEVTTDILLGEQVIVTSGCENVEVQSNSLYLVYRFNDSLSVTIDGVSQEYSPRSGDDPVCFVINVDEGGVSPFHIGIPRSYHNEFMTIPPFNIYASHGWTIAVYEFMTSNTGIDILSEPHVTLPNHYFNGMEQIQADELLMDFDVRVEMELFNNFTCGSSCRVELTFYGDLYHSTANTVEAKVQGALVGLILVRLVLPINGREAVFIVEQNPGQPTLFTLPEYVHSGTVINGVSFKTQYRPSTITGDRFFSRFLRSDLVNCPADVFVHLASESSLNYTIITTSCPALKIGGLYIPTNSLEHTLHIPLMNISNQPTTLHSRLARDLVTINEFLIIRQPDSGFAVDISFNPDGTIEGHINDCMFSVFDDVFTTSLVIMDETVSFTVPYVSVFGLLDVSLHGVITSGLEPNDVKVLVTGEVLNGSTFNEQLNQYFSNYVIDEIGYLNNRIEKIQESKMEAKALFDLHYSVIQEKMAVLENASEWYNMWRDRVDSLTQVVAMYQSMVDELVNDSLPLTNDILSLCSMSSCDLTCGVTDSCEVGIDRYPVDEWGIGSVTELDNLTRNIELDVDNYGWNIDYNCRLVTVIKSWGEAKFGQVCSYKSVYENNPTLKWVAEERETNVSHERPVITDSHELLLKTTILTDDSCAMEVSDIDCVVSDAACRIAQRHSINSLKPSDAINYQVINQLNEALRNLSVAKSEESLAYYQWSIAQHDYRIHKRLLQELSDVMRHFDEFQAALMEDNRLLLAMKSYVNDSADEIFELLRVDFTTAIEDYAPSIIPLRITYNVPVLSDEEHSTSVRLDLRSPLMLVLRNIGEVIATDIGHLLDDTNKTSSEGVSTRGITNQKQFEQRCSLVEDVRNYLEEIRQTMTDSATSTTNAKNSVSEISYENTNDLSIDLNTQIDFDLMFSKFGVSSNPGYLLSEVKNEEDYLTRVQVISEATKLEDNIRKTIDDTEHLSWFIGINTIHNASLMDSIGGDNKRCYGFTDCLSLVSVLLHRINNDLPSYLPYIEDNVLNTAQDSLYAVALHATSMVFNDVPLDTYLDPMVDVTNQIDAVGLWCKALPNITDQPPSITYAELGSEITLSCGPVFVNSYTWYRNGFSLEHLSPELTISSMAMTDEGQYQCVAFNEVGRTYSSFFDVMVTIQPELTSHPENISTFEGSEDEALFICNATGLPSPAYSWYFSRDRLNWVMVFNTSNEYVVYKPTKQSNEGWYRCSVTVLDTILYSDPAYLSVIGAGISRVSYSISFNMVIHKVPSSNLTLLHDIVQDTVQRNEDWQYGYIEYLNTELTKDETLSVSFRITTSYQYSINKTLLLQAREAGEYKRELDNIVDRVRERLENGDMDFTYNGTEYLVIPSTFIVSEEFFRCPSGQSLTSNRFICVNCSAGHHSGVVNNLPTCVPCERGTYTSDVGQGMCSSCPQYMSTIDTGLLTDDTCTDQCRPGSYSESGIIPCIECGSDEYQLEYGGTSCEPCNNRNISSQCPPPTEVPVSRGPGFTMVTTAVGLAAGLVVLTIFIIIIMTVVIFSRKKRDKVVRGRSNPREELHRRLDGAILPELNPLEKMETKNPLYEAYTEEDMTMANFEYDEIEPDSVQDPVYASVRNENEPSYAEVTDIDHAPCNESVNLGDDDMIDKEDLSEPFVVQDGVQPSAVSTTSARYESMLRSSPGTVTAGDPPRYSEINELTPPTTDEGGYDSLDHLMDEWKSNSRVSKLKNVFK